MRGRSTSVGPSLVLASTSPRRLELLRSVGVEPAVVANEIDETPLPGEEPADLVERLAVAKAVAGASLLEDRATEAQTWVLAADTVVVIDGEALGKPTDDDDARAMLERLAGRVHHALTGMAFGSIAEGAVIRCSVTSTAVQFRSLTDSDIEAYLATGEHRGKAGAYAIQGHGALLVDRIEGRYQNVVGLPLVSVDELLREFDLRLRDFVTAGPALDPDARPVAERTSG